MRNNKDNNKDVIEQIGYKCVIHFHSSLKNKDELSCVRVYNTKFKSYFLIDFDGDITISNNVSKSDFKAYTEDITEIYQEEIPIDVFVSEILEE